MGSAGVLVGFNQNQEWLLPWWWSHFRQYNPTTPVAFADFGMSESVRSWCQEKGLWISLADVSLVGTPTHKTRRAAWEQRWEAEGRSGDVWLERAMWFKKPIAMVHSPFDRTLWMDLDCEVKGPLEELFSLPLSAAKMAAASWELNVLLSSNNEILHQYVQYNSGVLLYERESPLLHIWVRAMQERGEEACTDDDLLSALAVHFPEPVTPLPLIYNWEVLKRGDNSDAKIYHWMGGEGKESILRRIYVNLLNTHPEDTVSQREAP